MSKRIIECQDGHKFIDVTDIAKLIWESVDVELYELDDDGTEHLINDKEHFDRAISQSKIVIE